MDYETFGEHQWAETGIFEFMQALPKRVFSHSNFTFATPSELAKKLQPVAPIHVPYPISWADEERDLTAWLGNDLQDDAFDKFYELESKVKRSNDPKFKETGNTFKPLTISIICAPSGFPTAMSINTSILMARHMMHLSII